MRGKLKESWREFRRGTPGCRFQARYERNRAPRNSRSFYWGILEILLASGLIFVGVVLMFIPGPAVLFFAIGAGILAGKWLALARLLDWTELRVRRLLLWVRTWWIRTSFLTRSAIVVLAALGTVGCGYLCFQILWN